MHQLLILGGAINFLKMENIDNEIFNILRTFDKKTEIEYLKRYDIVLKQISFNQIDLDGGYKMLRFLDDSIRIKQLLTEKEKN